MSSVPVCNSLIPDFAKAAAFFARAVRRIEREQPRIEFLEGAAATRATHLRAHDGESMLRVEQMRRAAADIERALHQIARFQNAFRIDRADDDIDGVFLEALELAKLRDRHELAIDKERVEALPLGPARDIGVKTFSRFDERREHLERSAFRRGLHLFHDRGEALLFHRQIAVRDKIAFRFWRRAAGGNDKLPSRWRRLICRRRA